MSRRRRSTNDCARVETLGRRRAWRSIRAMAAFDHRRADVSLRAHARRFEDALRKQDERALAELVLPRPPAWMLDRDATSRAWVGYLKTRTHFLPVAYGACLVTDFTVGRKAPWGKRDEVVTTVVAVSLDRGETWRFIDGIPDLGRMMTEPAFVGLVRCASQRTMVTPIFVSFGGRLDDWDPSFRELHAEVLGRMRRALPSAAAQKKALAFVRALVRRYQGEL